uniref:CUB domain-containing protein n=1 Tax=Panagrolaimus sp. PS1159 TaxID=55785 RepID=A0AC35F0Z9_9BILA
MFKLLLPFINLIFFINGQKLIDCSFNESISLNAGEWFKYESVDFPKSIALGPPSCRFSLNMSPTTQLWITPVNGFLGNFGINDWNPINNAFINIDTNTKVQTYLTKGLFETMSLNAATDVGSTKWYGFQTVGIAVDSFFGCPFNEIPINLTNSTTIIPISSTYYSLNSNETKYFPQTNCTWNFKTTDDYKFKFVYRYSKFSFSETLSAQINDEKPENITSNKNIGEAEAYYFNGPNLTLRYSAPQRTPNFYFYAVITVVKKTPIINASCNKTTYDLVNGYSNFESCSTTYNQSTMTQTRIKVELAAETCCDKLTIESGSSNFTLKPNMILNVNPKIESYNINFETDGSIVQGGYNLTSINFSCKNVTQDFIIPCNGTAITAGYKDGYCNNMNVKYIFTMEKYCLRGFNWLFNYNLRENSNDIIFYYIDNVAQPPITNSGGTFSGTNGAVNFRVEFTSNMINDSIFEIGDWSWNFEGSSKAGDLNIIYNLDMHTPTLLFNFERLRLGQELTVTVDPQFSLEMFIATKNLNNLTNFLLFESMDHTNFVGLLSNSSLFIINSTTFLAPKYETKSKVLTIQQNYDLNIVSDASVYFRITPSLPSECSNNNVYHVPEDYGNLTFPVISSETCQYSIITYGYGGRILGIETLYTNSTDSVQITGGSFNQTLPYFDFSESTANNYRDLKLQGSVFNFIIPKHVQTVITCGTKFYAGAYNSTQTISFPNERNIITSPNYGEVYSGYIGQTFLTTINSSFTQSSFLLSIINQNVSSSANFCIQGYGNNNIDLKSQNSSSLWINSSSFTVVYQDVLFSRFLISYQLVESEDSSTISIPTTTHRNNADPSKNFTVITLFIFLLFNKF